MLDLKGTIADIRKMLPLSDKGKEKMEEMIRANAKDKTKDSIEQILYIGRKGVENNKGGRQRERSRMQQFR